MADYVSSTGRSKTPLYLGLGAVALVIILALVSMGGGGNVTPSTPMAEPEPIAGPEAVAPAASEPAVIEN